MTKNQPNTHKIGNQQASLQTNSSNPSNNININNISRHEAISLRGSAISIFIISCFLFALVFRLKINFVILRSVFQ